MTSVKLRWILAAGALSWTMASPVWASRVYVEGASGSGVAHDDLVTATDLVKNAVPQVSSNQVVEQSGQADYLLRPRVTRLGSAYVFSLSKVEKDGTVDFSAQLKALQLEDLDQVASRLTRSVMAENRLGEEENPGEPFHEETHENNRSRTTRNAWYLGIGGSNLNALNVNGLGYSVGVAHAWDVSTAMIKVMAELSGLDSAFLASVGLGGNYFFTTADIAPYITGDFGVGAAKAEGGAGFFSGQSIGGFDGGIGAGVQFLRTASVNLDLGFRAGFLLFHSNQYGTPEAYSIRLGLLF